MYFSFIDIAFAFTIIVLLVVSIFQKETWRPYMNNLVATSNTLLIFYSLYLIKSLADLIRFVLSLNIKVPANTPTPPIGWFEIRYLLLILLPFLFISRRIAKSMIAALVMLLLLQWDVFAEMYKWLFTKQTSTGILFYMPYNALFKTLHFISLFIGTYALLWLLKRLPSQRRKR